MLNFLFHPLVTCFFGVLVGGGLLIVFLLGASGTNDTAQVVKDYRLAVEKAGKDGPVAGTAAEKEAQKRFGDFISHLGTSSYLAENTSKVYAEGAYFNDTVVTHHGPNEIRDYFLKTADTMTDFELTIDDVARSGEDHYFRWTMIFAAPKLAKGQAVHSVGMSQVRFNAEGQATMHQDFWDAGRNIFGQAPVAGGAIDLIRQRISKP